MTTPPCYYCGSSEWTLIFAGHGFDNAAEPFSTVQCAKCGLARTEPVLAEELLSAYYAPSYYGSFQVKFNRVIERMVLLFSRSRARSLIRRLDLADGRPPQVLDIGCGRGIFLRQLRQLGAECTGTEISSFALPDNPEGIRFLQGQIGDLGLPAAHFDLVSLWHVLEHTTDPAATLAEVSRVIRPNGLVVIAVPNFGSLQRRLFGKHWFHLDLPRHTHHFSLPVLESMLRGNNFTPVTISTSSGEQNLYGFVQSALNATFPRRTPNTLYKWLKAGWREERTAAERGRLAVDLLLAALYGLPGIVENIVSVARRQGATAIIYARKNE